MTRDAMWDKFVALCVKSGDAERDGMPGLAEAYGELASYWLGRWRGW